MTATRTEQDSMGPLQVPESALYGASTQRAVLNFPVSGRPVPDAIIHAYAVLKAACARANLALGLLDEPRATLIQDACARIDNNLTDHHGLAPHFPVDIFQTGSGTSTNMNVNEVVANLAAIALGKPIGSSRDPDYIAAGGVHPNDHVNMGQSSNDTFPSAIHIAAARAINDRLLPELKQLHTSLDNKAKQWDDVIKIGRTHLQDATPIRLGQEFSGYATQTRHAIARLERALETLCELPLGGTAVGTGINTHTGFGSMVAQDLAASTGIPFREASNHFEAQHAKDACVEASGHLKTVAVSLSKIANDIRWLGSGPRCGIGELSLPPIQPGSSIMPGKVNPVICEAVIMSACQVAGNDTAITLGGFGGVGSVLDLNVAMPMIAANLLDSIQLLAGSSLILRTRLLDGPEGTEGLEANRERAAELIEGSLAMCTSLVPVIGYDKSANLAKQAFKEGKTVRQLALEQNLLPEDQLNQLLDPTSMTSPSGD